MADTGTRAVPSWVLRMVVALAGCLLALSWLWVSRAGHPSDGTVISTASPITTPSECQAWEAVDGRPLTSAARAGQRRGSAR